MKWIVSSTMMPNAIAVTTAAAFPTSPTAYPHRPIAMAAGTKLGIKLIRPRRTLLKMKIRSTETMPIAVMVPSSMFFIFF